MAHKKGIYAGAIILLYLVYATWEENNVKRITSPQEEQHQQRLKSLYKSQDDDVSVLTELYTSLSTERLNNIAERYKAEYARNRPFPHIAIDGLFPERFIELVVAENPESLVQGNGCVNFGDEDCFRNGKTQFHKSAITHEDSMGPYTKVMFAAMKSSNFVTFLEQLSGIADIIPDPHFRGSGLHFTAHQGKLDIHADFNKYDRYHLDRRVNAFVFLNPDWPDEFGGHLELWSKDMESCAQKIRPALGRFVVFSSTDFSYHGHPQPLPAPAHRVRRSMALYYYTFGRPSHECLNEDCSGQGHTTLFQQPVACEVCEDQSCRQYMDHSEVMIPDLAHKLAQKKLV